MALRPIRLFVADVDGTLLNAHKEMSPATVKAIRDLRQAGIQFSLVSQRPPQGMRKLIDGLEIESICGALNGGVIIDGHGGMLSEMAIRPALVPEIVGVIEYHGLAPWIYTSDEWYVSETEGPHVHHEASTLGFPPTLFENIGEIERPVIKVSAIGDDYSKVTACEGQLREHHGIRLSISRSLANHLEITHPSANKEVAVTLIAEMLGIPLDEVATAGDGENDIPMFRVSALSIAMGQAPPEVHRAATHTTISNSQDGLAWAIENIILKHRS